VDKIVAFKDALGLAPEDAAAAHIDVGRRFQRLANESSKGQQAEYRKVGPPLMTIYGGCSSMHVTRAGFSPVPLAQFAQQWQAEDHPRAEGY